MARKHINYADLGTNWGKDFEVDERGRIKAGAATKEELILAALCSISCAMRMIRELTADTSILLGKISRLIGDQQAKKTEDPKEAREKHLAACRQRSMDAYLKSLNGQSIPKDAADEVLLESSVDVLDLDTRARKGVRRAGATTVRELCELTSETLLEQRNFGRASLESVREALAAKGLRLADDSGEDAELPTTAASAGRPVEDVELSVDVDDYPLF